MMFVSSQWKSPIADQHTDYHLMFKKTEVKSWKGLEKKIQIQQTIDRAVIELQ